MHLEARSLDISLDGIDIVRDQSLACAPGTMTGLVGPSGSGKTTLLHALGLLQPPTAGQVLVDGVDTSQWGAARRRRFWRDHATFVLQDYGVMEEESVGFNVTMTSSLWSSRVRGDRSRLQEALALTGLDGREDETASHLSGGEKQRLAVARAIYKGAEAIFVDEPTASLDQDNADRVVALLRERAQQGAVVVVATHDPAAMAECTRLHHLESPAHPTPGPAQTYRRAPAVHLAGPA